MESNVDNKLLLGKNQISVVYCYKLLMRPKKKTYGSEYNKKHEYCSIYVVNLGFRSLFELL